MMTDDLVKRVASAIRWKSMTSEEIARAAIAIALEEAAKVAEYELDNGYGPHGIAAAIRAMIKG